MKTFGEFAKQRLKLLRKSQKALAAKLGVSPAYVSQIFTGKKNPPDLGRPRNRSQLRVWSQFLEASEESILELILHELHRVPLRPEPKFGRMRQLLLECLQSADRTLGEEIRAARLHPAESRVIEAMIGIYFLRKEGPEDPRAYGATRFRAMCVRAKANREFVDKELVQFFSDRRFSWTWEPEANDVHFYSESGDIQEAIDRIREKLEQVAGLNYGSTVPVVGHVSAGEGFAYTDGGYPVGEGFEQVEIPPGIDPALARSIYCVRVRGDSLQPSFGDGTLLFIKPESWPEIRHGDLVIFKDRGEGRAFVKKVQFSGDDIILVSLNQQYSSLVRRKQDLVLLEKVRSVVFP